LCDLRRPADAVAVLGVVLAADPAGLEAWLVLARARLMLGQDAEALQAAGTAAGLAPADSRAQALAAAALVGLGRYAQAVAAARRAVQLAPGRPGSHDVLAVALLAAGAGAEAVQAAGEAVRLDPGCPGLRVTLGSALAAAGRRDEALAVLRDALEMDPFDAVAQHELARITAGGRNPLAARELAAAAAGFAGALGADPTQHISGTGLDLVLRTFLIRTTSCLALVTMAAARLATVGLYVGARAAALTGVLLPVAYAARFVRRLPPPLRGYLAAALAARGVRVPLACATAAGVLLVLAALTPPGPLTTLAAAAAVTMLVVQLRLATTTNRYARSHGIPARRTLGTLPLTLLAAILCLALLISISAAIDTGSVIAALVSLGLAAGVAHTVRVIRARDRNDRAEQASTHR
jgi:tetratricopeptide (TPR) repeat protein